MDVEQSEKYRKLYEDEKLARVKVRFFFWFGWGDTYVSLQAENLCRQQAIELQRQQIRCERKKKNHYYFFFQSFGDTNSLSLELYRTTEDLHRKLSAAHVQQNGVSQSQQHQQQLTSLPPSSSSSSSSVPLPRPALAFPVLSQTPRQESQDLHSLQFSLKEQVKVSV